MRPAGRGLDSTGVTETIIYPPVRFHYRRILKVDSVLGVISAIRSEFIPYRPSQTLTKVLIVIDTYDLNVNVVHSLHLSAVKNDAQHLDVKICRERNGVSHASSTRPSGFTVSGLRKSRADPRARTPIKPQTSGMVVG